MRKEVHECDGQDRLCEPYLLLEGERKREREREREKKKEKERGRENEEQFACQSPDPLTGKHRASS